MCPRRGRRARVLCPRRHRHRPKARRPRKHRVEARIVDGLWLDELHGLAGGADRGAAPKVAPCLAAAAADAFLVAIDDDDLAWLGAALPGHC